MRGRDFNEQDTLDAAPVVVISEKTAKHYWPNEDPIGKRLKPGATIAFEFVERSPGEWVITKVEPPSGSGSPKTKAAPHQGH